jgi:hypothetical protein
MQSNYQILTGEFEEKVQRKECGEGEANLTGQMNINSKDPSLIRSPYRATYRAAHVSEIISIDLYADT